MTYLFTTLGALGFILGLVLLAAALLRRTQALRGDPAGSPLEVVARTGIAPKQGVALVRMGTRIVALSYGEGGVRTLTELDPEEVRPRRRDKGVRAALDRMDLVDRQRAFDEELDEDFGEDFGEIIDGQLAEDPEGELPSLVFPPHRPWILNRGRLASGVSALFDRVAAALRTVAARTAIWALVGVLCIGAAGAVAPLAAQAVPDGTAMTEVPDAQGVLDALSRTGDSQVFSVQVGEGEDGLELSGPVGMVVFMGALTLLPTMLLLMTSFTRILVVLNLLKQAMGLQAAPPGQLLVALALLLTGFVMAPTLNQANEVAFAPWVAGEIDEGEMLRRTVPPFREFMLRNTREQDLASFVQLSDGAAPATVDDIPTVTVASAFITSELRAAFQIGFAVFLPFVVIDLVVSAVLMSMGMFMLPPVMVSLPLKLMLFVMVDGWGLIVDSLVRSFV